MGCRNCAPERVSEATRVDFRLSSRKASHGRSSRHRLEAPPSRSDIDAGHNTDAGQLGRSGYQLAGVESECRRSSAIMRRS
jgi:hypothetical protein